jgi:hypothetical protein
LFPQELIQRLATAFDETLPAGIHQGVRAFLRPLALGRPAQ